MKPKIIAFCAVKQAGKSTAVKVLQNLYPEIKELMLAGLLKDVCCATFGFKRSDAEDGLLKEKELDPPINLTREDLLSIMEGYREEFEALGIVYDFDKHLRHHCGYIFYSLRQILQYIGTEVLKGIDVDIHCKVIARKMISNETYTIPDMRFPSEFNFFHNDRYNLKAFYIKNTRAEALAMSDMHSSEKKVLTTASKCDKIENGGTLAEFEAEVQKRLKEIM